MAQNEPLWLKINPNTHTHSEKSGELQIISTQVSISGKAIKSGRILKPLCTEPLFSVPALYSRVLQARLSRGCPVLGLLAKQGEGHVLAPRSPHLGSSVGFCLSSPGNMLGPQLTSVVYEMKGPREASKGNAGPERSSCLELWDYPKGTQAKSASYSSFHVLSGDLNFKLFKEKI